MRPLHQLMGLLLDPEADVRAPVRWTGLALAWHMNRAGKAWPSVLRLAACVGLGESTVRAALRELCALGLFVREGGGAVAGDRYATAVYQVSPELPEALGRRAPKKSKGSRRRAPQDVSPSGNGVRGSPGGVRGPAPGGEGSRSEHALKEERSNYRSNEGAKEPVRAARADAPAPVVVTGPEPDGNGGKATEVEVLSPGAWPSNWTAELVDLWTPYGVMSHGQIGRQIKPLQGRYDFLAVRAGLARFLRDGKATFGLGVFIRECVRWVEGNGAGTASREEKSREVLSAWLAKGGTAQGGPGGKTMAAVQRALERRRE